MNTNLLKKTIEDAISKLEFYESNGEPLSSYEIGKLNAYDEMLTFINLLEETKL